MYKNSNNEQLSNIKENNLQSLNYFYVNYFIQLLSNYYKYIYNNLIIITKN